MNSKQLTRDSSSNEFLFGNLNYLNEIKDVKLSKRSRRPHSIKPLVITLTSLLVVSGGILVALDTTNHAEPQVADEGSQADAAQVQLMLGECLAAVSNAPEPGDPEFYPKLIANYKTQITCYNRYDSNNPNKKSLENELNNVEIAARDAGVSQSDIDAEYERQAALIEQEYQAKMAALDTEAVRQDAETQRRFEQWDAEAAQRRAEQTAQQAQYEAQKKAREESEARAQQEKIAKCNAYRAQYGSKTPQELAESDSEVCGRYDVWQRSIAKGKAATTPSEREKAKQQTYADYSAYRLNLQEKIGYYAQLSSVCD